jgi:hypothetical protein
MLVLRTFAALNVAFRAQTVDERLEPVGPQRVMDLRSITRLRRLGAAGSEQSMARTLTGAMTRPINASRQGRNESGPAVLRETTGPEEPSYAETPFRLGVPALGGAHRCGGS